METLAQEEFSQKTAIGHGFPSTFDKSNTFAAKFIGSECLAVGAEEIPTLIPIAPRTEHELLNDSDNDLSDKLSNELNKKLSRSNPKQANPALSETTRAHLGKLALRYIDEDSATDSLASAHPEPQIKSDGISIENDLDLDGFMTALPAAVVILDHHGVVNRCNAVAESLLGSQLRGKKWVQLIQTCFVHRLDDGHEVSLKDGRRVSLVTRSLPTTNGQNSGQLILINDQTDTRDLQTQLNRHKRLSEMGKMVSALAHQIRTPLAAALLHTGNLETAAHQESLNQETLANTTGRILSRLKHIERQIRDMLLFARGELECETEVTTETLLSVLQDAINDIPGIAATNRVNSDNGRANLRRSSVINQPRCLWVNQAPGARFRCNLDALCGALSNLIENALEASQAGECIEIQARFVSSVAAGSLADINASTTSTSRALEIAIKDSGSGISEQLQNRLQEPFYTSKPQGTGLGLAVARMVANAHHGAFFLESKPGQGTSATVRLPLQGDSQ